MSWRLSGVQISTVPAPSNREMSLLVAPQAEQVTCACAKVTFMIRPVPSLQW